ncbi:hypothetical protein DQ04_09061040 [Trypanosoma grayi]|uniref:hypothetical protein n=1 Tax=Trypanosoma grayi TaxID=71804 RepID=UPI0004F48AE3|nr:hypothetical protein DQ04_09061040 [Trypanosoma grayi]KEG07697.1 hypothetical protein DQ04_09061040 [Trypanosoma grayi]
MAHCPPLQNTRDVHFSLRTRIIVLRGFGNGFKQGIFSAAAIWVAPAIAYRLCIAQHQVPISRWGVRSSTALLCRAFLWSAQALGTRGAMHPAVVHSRRVRHLLVG